MISGMAIRLFQHRGMWYVEISGKRRSLKTLDKAEAKRLFNQIRKEWLAGKLAHLTGSCRRTMGEYYDEFLKWAEQVQPRATYRANRLALDKLIQFTGRNLALDRVSRKHLDDMTAKGLSEGLSVNSINNYIRHARAAMNKAVQWGYVQRNPLSSAKELSAERKPPNFLDRAGVARFLASIKDLDLRRMVVAYLSTGRRRSELLRLRWEDVDLEGGRYLVRAPKNHLSKWYPINSMFRAVLLAMEQQDGRVFSRFSHPDTISHYVKRALSTAGYGHLRLHDMRHTFASLQVMQGRDMRTVQELLGHTELKTTQISPI